MSFFILHSLSRIIADSLNDIERIYAYTHGPYASPPPSPSIQKHPPLDFPSLDAPYDSTSPAEQLTSHPKVVTAANKIIAAAAHISAILQTPFLSICDASMAYHLPSSMRLLEASHTVEILREAGPQGLHVDAISAKNGVDATKLAHILRLLATHHILRECAPNVFTINRISSLVDSGKSFEQLKQWEREGRPEMKYHNTDGIAAFVGLCTDEIQKSSAYLTEAHLPFTSHVHSHLNTTGGMRSHKHAASYASLSSSPAAPYTPAAVPFELAFGTHAGYFAWLEGVGTDANGSKQNDTNLNHFRLERFGKAMSGTGSWEAPGAVLAGFDWHTLPRGSTVVDVGGGIGSTSMLLAEALCRRPHSNPSESSSDNGGAEDRVENIGKEVESKELDMDTDTDLGLQFVIQDREVVVEMGEKAWRTRRPELLDSGTARFQVHDFFTPQPIKHAAVYLLRVVLHDWPDAHARVVLRRLREAAGAHSRLVLADFLLPLACIDGGVGAENGEGDTLDGIEGAESMLAPIPLLANLGKASANAYWMDMTMQVMFNSQERTLREVASLTLSAGWRVVRVTRAEGSLFGHIVAVPVEILDLEEGQETVIVPPSMSVSDAGENKAGVVTRDEEEHKVTASNRRKPGNNKITSKDIIERASSRCGTPTFGSRTELPSMQEAMARFGGGVVRSRVHAYGGSGAAKAGGYGYGAGGGRLGPLKQAAVLTAPIPPPLGVATKKKRPSPLSFAPPLSLVPSPSPLSQTTQTPAQAQTQAQSPPPRPTPGITRRMSHASLYRAQSLTTIAPATATTTKTPPPPSPLSPRYPPARTLTRRASHAQLQESTQGGTQGQLITPSSPLVPLLRHSQTQTQPQPQIQAQQALPKLSRRASHATLSRSSSSIPLRQPAGDPPASPLSPVSPTSPASPASPIPTTSSLSPSPLSPAHAEPALRRNPPSPITPRHPRVPIPRRPSYAQLPQTTLRNRAGSVVGGGSGGIGGGIGMGSLLGGGVLSFSREEKGGGAARVAPRVEHEDGGGGGGGSVLAAAARIDRKVTGLPVTAPSP